MFGFLKEKLKGAISKFTKKAEKELPEEEKIIVKAPEKTITEVRLKEQSKEAKSVGSKAKEIIRREIASEPEKKKPELPETPEKKGFLNRIFGIGKKEELKKEKELKKEEEPQEEEKEPQKEKELENELDKEQLPEQQPEQLSVERQETPVSKSEVLEKEKKAGIPQHPKVQMPVKEEIKPARIHSEIKGMERIPPIQKKPIIAPKPAIEKVIENSAKIHKIDSAASKIEQVKSPVPAGIPASEAKELKSVPVLEQKIPKTIRELKEKQEEKKSFFGRIVEKITTTTISEQQFEEMFWDLEVALLENNVAVEVIEKIKEGLSAQIVGIPIARSKITETVESALRENIEGLFDVESFSLIERIRQKSRTDPYVIVFVGVNGSGKTTTIAKMAKLCLDKGLVPVIAAADTFRAAAIDQLETHTNKLGVKLIKHDYGSDSAAVAFDAIKHAKAAGKHVVLIDTAGRLHSNINLMDELKKVIRVAKPDSVLFIGESITGNDCVEQAKKFSEYANIDGIILAKADIDEKGGAAVSISYITRKPILYLGTGQGYDDLVEFDPKIIIKNIGLEAY